MDKNLKVMNRELREGKNLEENLPGFLNKMAGVYHRYAMLEPFGMERSRPQKRIGSLWTL